MPPAIPPISWNLLYQPDVVLAETGGLVLARGWRRDDGQRVLLRYPRHAGHAEGTARLRTEATMLALLQGCDAVLTPLVRGLLPGDPVPALVYADVPGQPVELGTPLALDALLQLGRDAALALAQVHQRGVLHRDLKPASLLYDPASRALRLTHFAQAARLQPDVAPPALLADSLAYLAPEHTGRMARAADARADLYSLGVLLFALATGTLPFLADDALAYAHQHMAQRPPDLLKLRPDLPQAVCDIIDRLLRKAPERRYQSAAGLAVDLASCLILLQQQGSTAGFAPGRDEVSAQLVFSDRLHGREAELCLLQGRLEEALAGGRLMPLCVGGAAGVGKSSLIAEFFKTTLEDRGHLLAGKCEALKQHVPYMAIAAAMEQWVIGAKSAAGNTVEAWSRRLQDALGPDAGLVAQLIPSLAWLLGPGGALPAARVDDGQQRLQGALVRMLLALATPHEPLLLFLDDLQWSDHATLQLCERLMRGPAHAPVLLILAYRAQEVPPTHPFQRMRDRVASSGVESAQLDLLPLDAEAVTLWLADVLHQPPQAVAPLAALIHGKTAGNPFFMREFISRLRDEALLCFEDARGAWTWEAGAIAAAPLSDNLADLVEGRLSRLLPEAVDILSTAACIGHRFTSALLAQACGVTVQPALDRACAAQLLVARGQGAYAFAHDKVAQAAYALCPPDARAEKHAQLGALLLRARRADPTVSLFEVVNHLNRADPDHSLLSPSADLADVVDLVDLNIQAGQQARAAAAFAEARTYYERARALLPADAWRSHPETALATALGLGECLFVCGAADAGLQLLRDAMPHGRDAVERIAVHRVIICQLHTAGRSAEALQACSVALEAAGLRLDGAAVAPVLQQQRHAVQAHLAGQSPRALLELPSLHAPLPAALLGLISDCGPALAGARPDLFALAVAHGMSLCLAHGNCPESCFTYSAWGMLLASHDDDFHAACAFGELAVELAERVGHLGWIASARFMLAVQLAHWTRPLSESQAMLESALSAAQHASNLAYATSCVVLSPLFMLEAGAPLHQVLVQSETCLSFAHERRLPMWITFLQRVSGFCRTLQGLAGPDDAAAAVPEAYAAQLRQGGHMRVLAALYLLDGLQAMLAGQLEQAQAVLARLQPLARSLALLPQLAQYTFLQGWTAQRSLAAGHAGQDWHALLAHAAERFAVWSRSCPHNYASRAHLLQALQAMLGANPSASLQPLEMAISCADQFGQPLMGSLAAQLAGDQARAGGLQLACARYYREAVVMAARAGAHDRADRLKRHYGLAPAEVPMRADASIGHLDGVSVAKACQTISSEMELGALLRILLPVVIESVGAERGDLLL